MARPLEDSTVVITGATSGIGRATALRFARRKANVVATARREDALRRLAEESAELGGRVLAVPADATDEQAVRTVADRAVERFGRIDAWVNNAAVTLFARFDESPAEDFRRVIETNLFGYVHGARAALPYFREQGGGVLINVSSVAGKVGQPFTSAYVVSKFAIVGLSASLRMELQDAPGIHVCTVLPASIDTPLFQHGANYTGQAVKPLEPIYDAERVARAIVDAAVHPRREIVVGAAGRWMLLMWKIQPAIVERIMASQVEKGHFQDVPADSTAGNLFEPMRLYESVSGGWRTDSRDGKLLGGIVVAATGLGFGVTRFLLRRSARRKLRFFSTR